MSNIPEVTPPCCEVWSSLVPVFEWYRFDDFPHLLAMPCLRADGDETQWRVNYCPSCGAERRSAVEQDWRGA